MKDKNEILYALVTGASNGIGFALTKQLLKNYHVIAVSRTIGQLEKITSDNITHWQYDLSINGERETLIERLENSVPHLNLLVNSAGIQQELGFNIGEWVNHRQEIELNLIAPIHLTIELDKILSYAPDPVVINIGSVLGFSHRKISPIYSVTKAGIHQFSRIQN